MLDLKCSVKAHTPNTPSACGLREGGGTSQREAQGGKWSPHGWAPQGSLALNLSCARCFCCARVAASSNPPPECSASPRAQRHGDAGLRLRPSNHSARRGFPLLQCMCCSSEHKTSLRLVLSGILWQWHKLNSAAIQKKSTENLIWFECY